MLKLENLPENFLGAYNDQVLTIQDAMAFNTIFVDLFEYKHSQDSFVFEHIFGSANADNTILKFLDCEFHEFINRCLGRNSFERVRNCVVDHDLLSAAMSLYEERYFPMTVHGTCTHTTLGPLMRTIVTDLQMHFQGMVLRSSRHISQDMKNVFSAKMMGVGNELIDAKITSLFGSMDRLSAREYQPSGVVVLFKAMYSIFDGYVPTGRQCTLQNASGAFVSPFGKIKLVPM